MRGNHSRFTRRAIGGVAATLLTVLMLAGPATAGISNEGMARPWNANGHPRSWIKLTGKCGALYCEASYKIQYSYWGWRTSGNSRVIVALNRTNWTGRNATCNKSPGTYRGRMDLKVVNSTSTSLSFTARGMGGSVTVPGLDTQWIRSSSPHRTGLRC